MKGLFTSTLLVSALALSGCELTDEEKEKLDNAAVDLQQLADQIIITYPAKDSEITDSMVTVRADIPASAQAQEVRLLVDGIEIAKDSDGAPWEIEWPAYYFADGGKHTLLLKTITGEGNEVRNNEQFQVTIKEEANEALIFEEGIDGRSIQDEGSLSFTFAAFEGVTGYEVLVDGELFTTDTASINLNNLTVGTHSIQYRVLHDRLDETPFSQAVTFEVLPAALPTLNEVVIDGINITLSWETISEGDSYDVYWGEEGSALELVDSINTNSYTIAEAETGNFEWAIRRTNALGQQSLLSDKTIVELLPPVLPVINEPIVEYKEDDYKVTFSWEILEEGDSYTIYFGKVNEELQAQTATTKNFLEITNLELGQYQWKLQRTNTYSQSVTGTALPISVGAFRVLLKKSADYYGKKVFNSQDGGYFVLGTTTAYGDSNGDDWIVKLSSKGEIEWEYVIQHKGAILEIRQLEDGFLYGVGSTKWNDLKGYAVKINPQPNIEDRLIWQKEYRNDAAIRSSFKSFVNVEEELFISSNQHVCIDEACNKYSNQYKLYKINTNNGDEVSQYDINFPDGKSITSTSDMILTDNNELALAITVGPDGASGSGGPIDGGILNLNLNGQHNWIWDFTGQYEFAYGDHLAITPWGDFVLTGLGHMGLGINLAYINADGTEGTAYRSYRSQYSVSTPVFDKDENTIQFAWADDTNCAELWATSKSGHYTVLQEYCDLNILSGHQRDITTSVGDSLVLMFESTEIDGQKSIYIMKTNMQGNM